MAVPIRVSVSLYAYIRHPQYVAFIAMMFGFLLQWPTIPTLIMFPVLAWMYVRLAETEQEQMRAEFGDPYDSYASAVPAFIPHLGYGLGSTELPR